MGKQQQQKGKQQTPSFQELHHSRITSTLPLHNKRQQLSSQTFFAQSTNGRLPQAG